MKKFILALIVLAVICQIGFASNVTFRWKYVGEEPIDYFETKFNGGAWTKVDASIHKMSFEMTEKEALELKDDAFQIRSVIGDRYSEAVTAKGSTALRISNRLNVTVSPYSQQLYFSDSSYLKSKYSFGATVSEQSTIVGNLYAELGLGFQMSFLESQEKPVSDLFGFAGLGFEVPVNEDITAFVNADVGYNGMFFESFAGKEIVVRTGLGMRYMVSEKYGLIFSVNSLTGFVEDYSEYLLVPALGVSYKF